jgi:predicted RNase H-like HicB family nuclease
VEFEEGRWYGHGLEMPTVFGDGRTVQAAVADTREALVTAVAYLLEKGRPPPAPAREGHRSVQVNVRLTPEEKAVLDSRAKAKGFRGLSDFIRTSVLAER